MGGQFLFIGSDGAVRSAAASARATALAVIWSKAVGVIASRATILRSILGGFVPVGRASAKASVKTPPLSPIPTHSVTKIVGRAGPSTTGGSVLLGDLAKASSLIWLDQDGALHVLEST